MCRRVLGIVAAVMVALGLSSSVHAGPLGKTVHGKPALKSIQVLEFAPEGVLLVGDGVSAQVVAIQTGDTKSGPRLDGRIEDLPARFAEMLGTMPEGIEILDMAVNPVSGTAYFAVLRQADKQPVILTVDGQGKLGELNLDSVDYAVVSIADGQTKISRITDVAWAGDRLIAAAGASEEFASKIFVISAPLSHEAKGNLHSAETYHVAHRKWETKAPMSVVVPFTENGKQYVVGAFSCTPVVRYALDDLSPGAKVQGESVLELGSGNRPLDMFTYEKNGRGYVIANTFRFHHERRPFGPSPYWTVRFDRDLLSEKDQINESALRRLDSNSQPATDRVVVCDSYHGVMQLAQLDESRALVLRKTADGRIDLEPVDLP